VLPRIENHKKVTSVGTRKDAGDELADRPAAGDARDEYSDDRCP